MKILERLNNITRNESNRDYIGASSIGHPCLRKIWYEYKHPELKNTLPARNLRILELGHKIEELVKEHLKRAGINVLTSDNTFYDSNLPCLKGHVDGILPDENMVLEIKSCKDSSFKIFQKKGLKGWFETYYYQVQCYMAFTQLEKALVIAFNKDTADLHTEVINFNRSEYDYLVSKARAIHNAEEAPAKLSENPTWFQCKMCDFRKICHKEE